MATTACPSLVHSRVTVYHASKIDLRYCRSLHSCRTCRLGPDATCGAVHYGQCNAVLIPNVKHHGGRKPASERLVPAGLPAGATRVSSTASHVPSSPASTSLPASPRASLPPGGVQASPEAIRMAMPPNAIAIRSPNRAVVAPSNLPGSPTRGAVLVSPSAQSASLPGTPSSPSPSSPSTPASPRSSRSVSMFSGVVSGGRGSGPSSPVATTPESPRSRSLSIQREGHELAGAHLDVSPGGGGGLGAAMRPGGQTSPLRHRPQRQVFVQGQNIHIGPAGDPDARRMVVPVPYEVAAVGDQIPSAGVGPCGAVGGGGGGVGVGGGVAITIQHGQTNITSGGNTDIKIQGQGHEIHIQGSGGQNIRVHQAGGGGGGGGVARADTGPSPTSGHVIKIKGQGPQPPYYPHHHQQQPVVSPTTPEGSAFSSAPKLFPRPAHPPPPATDTVDSAAAAVAPAGGGGFPPVLPLHPHGSFVSSRQIQKPTARVAPAPSSATPTPAPAPTDTPSSVPAPSGADLRGESEMVTSPSPPPTPPFPLSSSPLPPDSPPVSPPPSPTLPLSPLSPTSANQPAAPAHHKDRETNHVAAPPGGGGANEGLIKEGGGAKALIDSRGGPTSGQADVIGRKGGAKEAERPGVRGGAHKGDVEDVPSSQKGGASSLSATATSHAPANNHKSGGGPTAPGPTSTPQDNNKENKPKKRGAATTSNSCPAVSTPGAKASSTEVAGSVGPGSKQRSSLLYHQGSRPGSVHIKPFYFPQGEPCSGQGNGEVLEQVLHKVRVEFSDMEGGKAYKQQMSTIIKACGLPVYWKILLFRAAGGSSEGFITFQSLSSLLKKLFQSCHDDSSKFIRLAGSAGSNTLCYDDFEPLIQDVVETHPGLTFLQDAPEFHSRYVTTVISRIFFCVNRSWSGRISLPELRRANFLKTLGRLESEEDINQVKDFFSYEHFYVIYCKFWELDKDHDLYIDKHDLSRHNDHALNSRLIDRIFSGAVTRGPDFQEGRMSYREFVWFLLAEEDKKHPTSVEYWFRCMDLDGNGLISMYEMEFFHEEQMNKMETLGIERLPFEDTVCQMMDMVCPRTQGQITLGDLKTCKMTNIFFDTFFNLDKFLEHEQRDPFANARDPNAEPVEVSDWNKYAEEEYDILVADEGNNDMEEGNYEDDFEPEDDDELLREEMLRLADTGPAQRNPAGTGQSHTAEDIYDFSGTSNLGY